MSVTNDFDHLKIHLKDIKSATNDFRDKPIGIGGFGKVYKGKLSFPDGERMVAFKRLQSKVGQGDIEFWKEVMMLSQYSHENLISLLGFCSEDVERILIYEYAPRGSLDRCLGDASVTWMQRLNICLGAARGLNYLHDPKNSQQRVLHRDIKSSNILLDENWTAKVSDFGLSKIAPANQQLTYLISNLVGTPGYCDPVYWETGLLSKESDVYSFGVVLFEVMCGRLCYDSDNGRLTSILVRWWKRCCDENRLDAIINNDLKQQMDQNSLVTFSAIASECLNRDRKERPNMAKIVEQLEVALKQQNSRQDKATLVKIPVTYKTMEEFHHLQIQMQNIVSATNNFDAVNLIGKGGFGSVYKGEIYLPAGLGIVAFKRLDRKFGQGTLEFWREIMILSKHKHENLVSLLHFCNEGAEMILVYEYVSRGSLDRHLSNTQLSWTQRLKICIGVTRALNYLHDLMEIQVLHRDIKSSNILLDDKWTAKVSDFGLSKVNPAKQTYIFSQVVGTPGYCDPKYLETGLLSKKTDVYSFGVLLVEIICGRLCVEYRNGDRVDPSLVHSWKNCYDDKRLDDIIFSRLKGDMKSGSLNTFSAITYKCLKNAPEERPTMAEIVIELEIALERQHLSEDMMRIADLVLTSLPGTSASLHSFLLSKGTLVEDGNTWISITKNGKTCEEISAIKCISANFLIHDTIQNSRFSNVLRGVRYDGFKIEGTTRFLLPHVTYTVNLVLKHGDGDHGTHMAFKFKVGAQANYSNSMIGHIREDGWLMIELYQFTSYRNEHDFRIEFLPLFRDGSLAIQYLLEGIEFRPVEYVT